MLHNPGIESVLRRELDSLPLPPQDEWLPAAKHDGAPSTAVVLAAGSLLIVGAFVAGPAIRDWRESQSAGSAARPTPLVLPTVVNGIGISPLRNAWRNPALGYNIVLQANWRESARWQSVPGDPMLVGRATNTAQSPEQELALLNRYGTLAKLPWDLNVELWSSGGLSALEWARSRGGCAAPCTVGNTRINGTDFLTTVDTTTGVHAFYVTRGDRLLVFSYIIGTAAEQPAGVTVEILEQSVRSVGLP
jgi:hypothetical protein